MKSFATIAAISLATVAAAHPDALRTRQADTCIVDTNNLPSQTDIVNSINQWNDDVNNVNSFLNAFADGTVSDVGSAASTALLSAQDEPCQLSTLSNLEAANGFPFNPNDGTDFACAVNDLGAVFGDHVISNLNKIIADPFNTDSVNAAVGDINFFRCCNVLPDASILWLESAEDNGSFGSVPTVAGRPNTCSSIDCSGVQSCAA